VLIGADAAILKDSKYRGLWLGALGLGSQVGVMLPFSRANETESDESGLRYAAAAGYDPTEAARFWTRFAKATQSAGGTPKFLSTHPSSQSRIENLKRLESEAMALYEKSPKHGLGEKF
jgi:predicted Zn-dependent protease